MKVIDSKGKFFGKISIVDLFVLILVIACICAIGLKLNVEKNIHGGNHIIQYTVRVENVRDVTCKAIQQSKEVEMRDATSGYSVGNIIDDKVSNYRGLVQTSNGEWAVSEYSDRYSVDITLETPGTETETGYYAESGEQLSVGNKIKLKSEYIEFETEIISLSIVE